MYSLLRLTVFLAAVWLVVIFCFSGWPLIQQAAQNDSGQDGGEPLAAQLGVVQERLRQLQADNDRLRSLLTAYQSSRLDIRRSASDDRSGNGSGATTGCYSFSAISKEESRLRFALVNGVQEFWYFISAEARKLVSGASQGTEVGRRILDLGAQQKRSIQVDLALLEETEVRSAWRRVELTRLGDEVQRRLHDLQNPADCESSKRLLCHLNKGCGYGCQIHHTAYCFVLAYGTGRTLVLQTKNWRYTKRGWDSVFQPVSKCEAEENVQATLWNGAEESAEVPVVSVPVVDTLSRRPPFLPLAIPEDIALRLETLHSAPSVWWIGQLVAYLTRPTTSLAAELARARTAVMGSEPLVGLHVRRTDKIGGEAAFHPIKEYMTHVEDWFDLQDMRTGRKLKRKVFLATDDPSVLDEARREYPHVTFVGSKDTARSAGLASRYSDASLHGVIADVHILSRCHYLVCTFSSQVCRLAYELMQVEEGGRDFGDRFFSLDDIFYFGGQGAHEQEAIYAHSPASELEMELIPGDIVNVAGNHWDGWSKGSNRRTGATGLYPSWKVKERVPKANMQGPPPSNPL